MTTDRYLGHMICTGLQTGVVPAATFQQRAVFRCTRLCLIIRSSSSAASNNSSGPHGPHGDFFMGCVPRPNLCSGIRWKKFWNFLMADRKYRQADVEQSVSVRVCRPEGEERVCVCGLTFDPGQIQRTNISLCVGGLV